jgi:hypothetical protein
MSLKNKKKFTNRALASTRHGYGSFEFDLRISAYNALIINNLTKKNTRALLSPHPTA